MAEETPKVNKQVVDPKNKRGGASRSNFAAANALTAKELEARLRTLRPGADFEQLPQETAYDVSDAEREFAGARALKDPETGQVIRGPIPKVNTEGLRPTYRQTAMAQAAESLPVPQFSRVLSDERSRRINEAGEEAELNDPKVAYANVRKSIAMTRSEGFRAAAARSQNQLAGLEEVQTYREDSNNNANFVESETSDAREKREKADDKWERETGSRNKRDADLGSITSNVPQAGGSFNDNTLAGLEIPSSLDEAKYHQIYGENLLNRASNSAPHMPHQRQWGYSGDWRSAGESMGRLPGTQAEMDKALAEGARLTGQRLSSPSLLPAGEREAAYAEIEASKGEGAAFGSITGSSHKVVKATSVERSLNTDEPNRMGYPTGITETPTNRIHIVHMDGNARIGHSVLPASGGTVTDITPTDDGNMMHTATTYDGSGNQVGESVQTPLRVSRTGLSKEESEQVKEADPQVIVHNGSVLHRPEDNRPLDVLGQAQHDADQAQFAESSARTSVRVGHDYYDDRENLFIARNYEGTGRDKRHVSSDFLSPSEKISEDVLQQRESRIAALYAASGKTQDVVNARLASPAGPVSEHYQVSHLIAVNNGNQVRSGISFYKASSPEHAIQQHLAKNPGVGGLEVEQPSSTPRFRSGVPSDWFEATMEAARNIWRKHHGEAHESEYTGSKTEPYAGVDTVKLASMTGGILPAAGEMDSTQFLKPNPSYVSKGDHAANVLKSQSDLDLLQWHLTREAKKAEMAHQLKVQAVMNGGASRGSLINRVIAKVQPPEGPTGPVA
jgi:hypothetical protein